MTHSGHRTCSPSSIFPFFNFVCNLEMERQRGRLLIRQWDGRCSLPCEEEQVKLTCQGVSQTQTDQAWVDSVSVDNGEQRGKNNQKTEKKRWKIMR